MKLVHASISENNDSGWNGDSKAGDQTGKEVCIREWYEKPWDFMLHYPDESIAQKAVSAAVKLAKSNLVGYDQSERNTLYNALKHHNFNVDEYIKSGVKTETDCSAFIYAVYCCFIPAMRSNDNAPVTMTMDYLYRQWGFVKHTGNGYLTGHNLTPGDILVNELSHTAMVCDDTKTDTETTPVNIIDLPIISEEVNQAITTIAEDVIRGNWSNGQERKEKLYVAIQTRVNELLK